MAHTPVNRVACAIPALPLLLIALFRPEVASPVKVGTHPREVAMRLGMTPSERPGWSAATAAQLVSSPARQGIAQRRPRASVAWTLVTALATRVTSYGQAPCPGVEPGVVLPPRGRKAKRRGLESYAVKSRVHDARLDSPNFRCYFVS